MTESGYYPPGAEYDSRAPWNREEPSEEEVEVLVSVTLSKTVKVKVTDYEVITGKDEDGDYIVTDFSNCDLKTAVEEQITLPQDTGNYLQILKNFTCPNINQKHIEDLKDWNVDEMEVILE